MLGIIGGLLSGIGGLIGDKSSSEESFNETTDSDTSAESQDLSPQLLAALEGLFSRQVGGGGFERAGSAVSARLGQILDQAAAPQFDVTGFARGVSEQAASVAGLDLESSINEVLSSSGTSEKGNSMSALLGNKLRNATAANFAGISSQATAQGEQIRQSQQQLITESIAGLSGNLQESILGLIQATRGASMKGTSKTHEVTSGTSKSSGKKQSNPFSSIGSFFGKMGEARSNA